MLKNTKNACPKQASHKPLSAPDNGHDNLSGELKFQKLVVKEFGFATKSRQVVVSGKKSKTKKDFKRCNSMLYIKTASNLD